MSRYIDADALKQNLKENYTFYGFVDLLKDFYVAIDEEPSIDIVRCGECKYKQQCHKAVEHTTRDITSVTIAYRPIDFCSFGEREDE